MCNKMLKGGVSLFASLFVVFSAEALMPHTSQTITLARGWNAVYVEVSPEKTADELFAWWPVGHVGLYDPASFLATRQFSSEWNSQGLQSEAMAVWYRDAPEASTLKTVPGGSILVTFCNDTSFVDTFRGAPAAPRTTWHVTDTNKVYNFVGFSVAQPNTDIAAYLEGSPCEDVKSRAYYRIVGTNPNAAPDSLEVRSYSKTVSDGEVLLLPSDKISDWSGVLHVSPINGVDFGQTGSRSMFSIRNDGTASREVSISLERAINHDELYNSQLIPWVLEFSDMDVAATNGVGVMVGERIPYYGMAWHKTLAAGETWRVEVGLNRPWLEEDDRMKGRPFGALLKITEDSAAHAKVVVPIHGETSGEEFSEWQNGLWVADVELNEIQLVEQRWVIESNTVDGVVVVTTNAVDTALDSATQTGGKFRLRLPIHRDAEGKARLLQRVVMAGDVSAGGNYVYRLYAGTASPPDTAKTLMRISSVCLPTETPVIEASQESLWDYGALNHTAKFEFTVGAYGATSLLRHPYHPQHDGLRWDFVTHAPDGDNVYNYKSDVKPETFSVQNEIDLQIDCGDEVSQWNPRNSFDGTCRWTLSGLRHDGKIVVSGPMVLRRISPNIQLILK